MPVSSTRVLERPGASPADAVTSADTTVADRKPRVIGVDVARGLALIGMMATHVFGTLDDNDNPTIAHVVAGGRAATTFVLVAGVSLAFLSGGPRGVHGRERIGASAGLAVRAVLVGAIGLALGYLSDANGIFGILQFYAVLFLLAIPLLGFPPMALLGIAAALTILGPMLLVATADAGLPYAGSDAEPTFTTLFQDPVGLLAQLFLTGEYPVVVYLAYLCVGLAIGRLDLRSPRLAWVLLGAGAAIAIASRIVSAVLLYPIGGLARLIEQDGLSNDPADVSALLWQPEESSSWWYLALPAPHSHTPIDLLHTVGSAAAVLGAALLLTRIPAISRALSPLAAAGAMSLTLYSAHLILLATGVQDDQPALTFLAMVVGALVLAWAWRYLLGQGPLEALVAKSATAARRGVARLMPQPRPGQTERHHADPEMPTTEMRTTGRGLRTTTRRGAKQLLAPMACAGVLALSFLAGAQLTAPQGAATTDVADASVSDLADAAEATGDEATADEATEVEAPDAAAAPPLPSPASPTAPADAPAPPTGAEPNADPARYCALSDQLYALYDAHPDQPRVIVEKAATQLTEMPQAAPAQIRDAVTVVLDDLRAEAGVPGATAPDEATLTQAEATVEAFEEQSC
jgi:uncharacterized membrane protein